MSSDYWQRFWEEQAAKSTSEDPQVQVLRTLNKDPIDAKTWEGTLEAIFEQLDLKAEDIVLDLCCGNGLISKELALRSKSVTAVDLSSKLLDQIDTSAFPNIIKLQKNVLSLDLPRETFNKILIYAGIQYFSPIETIQVLQQAEHWLLPGGLLYLGDIPDQKKLWAFFNNKEREYAYFTGLKDNKPIVGEWFDTVFLEKLGSYAGFSKVEKIKQPAEMIYSFFRYDMKLTK